MRLHGYFRSSASYRVRIALNLKGLGVEHLPHHLRKGEQRAPAYLAINPQGLVPTLEDDTGTVITQSLAIMAYLDEAYPSPPLYPDDMMARAKVRNFAAIIVSDIHPLNNLRVLRYLKRELHQEQPAIDAWYRHWIAEGLPALEAMLTEHGPFCFGAAPTLADVCLVPQLANARRYECPLDAFPRLCRAEAACHALPAFQAAAPERQPDAE